jgi:hypothetical protein
VVQLESLSNLIVALERGVRWAEVKQEWHQIRSEWLERLRSCEVRRSAHSKICLSLSLTASSCQCVEDLFTQLQVLIGNFVEDQIPPSWKEDTFQLELKRCTDGATAKQLIKIIFLCASSIEKRDDRPPGAFEALYTDLLQYLRAHVLKGIDIGMLFPQMITENKVGTLSRSMKRLEVGINWSGVMPAFRDLRMDWILSLSNATSLNQLVEVWKTFESFCAWENLGPTFIPLRLEWQKRLSECQDESMLAQVMLDMESHCVPERLSGIYRSSDRAKWRAALSSIASIRDVPSLKSMCCKKAVTSNIPTDACELPLDVLDLLDEIGLAYKLIASGAREHAITTPYTF